MSRSNSERTIAAAILLALGLNANAQDLSQEIDFNIPPRPLAAAIIEFSKQAGVQVVTAGEDVSTLETRGVTGRLKISKALEKLLSGTELEFRAIGESTVALVAQPLQTTQVRDEGFRFTRVAAMDGSGAESSSAHPQSQEASAARRVELEEVIVTGSHIRGVQDLSAPVIRLSRDDIEASGYSSTQDLMRSLTQNLSDVSEATVGNQNGGPGWLNNYQGSGVNLRGLGSSATLVLLNGRRVAGSGDGSYFDLSLIPISAIERIDVLTDGASALYGSDAISGVVNVVLRKDFTGAETRVRYGSVTEGSREEKQAGQLVGVAWEAGRALVSFDYQEASPLMGTERDFFVPSESMPDISLYPMNKRHSVFGTWAHRFTDRIELSGDFIYADRETDTDFAASIYMPSYRYVVDAKQYGGAVGLSMDAGRGWQARLTGTADFAKSNNDMALEGGAVPYSYSNDTSVSAIDLAADGSLMALPGGEVRAAIGGQYRREGFEEFYYDDGGRSRLDRNISALYAELMIPWVGAQNSRAGVERLELTVAARYEDYSDFGTAFNPKVGLSWAPVRNLNVRGTWGTSFRAPLLHQLDPNDITVGVYLDQFSSSSGAPVTGMLLMGSGAGLGPEESENFTAGFDFTSDSVAGLTVSGTYYQIDYESRVSDPLADVIPFEVTVDPTYAHLVTQSPGQALAAGYMNVRGAFCYTAAMSFCETMPPPSSVEVLVDGRMRNFARTRQSGIDLSGAYQFKSAIGDWGVSLGGTRLLRGEEQMSMNGRTNIAINNVWRPVDLRLRGSVAYTRGALNASAFLNYTDGYRDRRPGYYAGELQRSHVGSWTTLDLTVRYSLSASGALGWLKDAALTLSGMNVLDRDPPFVGALNGMHYDGVNATPLGRFLSVQFVAQWGR